LVHEAIFPGYGIPEYHTLSHEVGVVAHECHAKRLVMTHLLPGHIPAEQWFEHARLGFDGPIDIAYDLMKVV
jgi:ribonuclease BN (tRNA processing enzyme)